MQEGNAPVFIAGHVNQHIGQILHFRKSASDIFALQDGKLGFWFLPFGTAHNISSFVTLTFDPFLVIAAWARNRQNRSMHTVNKC
ncbi:hypothetical protein D3C75_259550 [compost metagenome]